MNKLIKMFKIKKQSNNNKIIVVKLDETDKFKIRLNKIFQDNQELLCNLRRLMVIKDKCVKNDLLREFVFNEKVEGLLENQKIQPMFLYYKLIRT